MHEHDVAEVHLGLPGLQRLIAHPGQADHHLQLRPVALLQGGEAQLAGIAGEHHPAGDAYDVAGGGIGDQVRVGGTDLGERMRARHGHRVGLVPLGQQSFALALTDPELFGNLGPAVGFRNISRAHDVPA